MSAAAPETSADALLDTVMLQLRLAQVLSWVHFLLLSTNPRAPREGSHLAMLLDFLYNMAAVAAWCVWACHIRDEWSLLELCLF